MRLEIKVNRLKMSRRGKKLALEAIARMKASKDPAHDIHHITKIWEDLNKLRKEHEILKELNWEVVTLAIVWHDVWVAEHIYESPIGMIWRYLWEGEGSARLFEKRAMEVGLKTEVRKRVVEAIKNHPGVPWVRHRNLEARVLWDLDNLETWSSERLRIVKGDFLKKVKSRRAKRRIKLARMYFNKMMKKRTGKRLYFGWTREQFETRKKVFLKEMEKAGREYERWLLLGN